MAGLSPEGLVCGGKRCPEPRNGSENATTESGRLRFSLCALMVMGGEYFVCGDYPFHLGSVEEYDK